MRYLRVRQNALEEKTRVGLAAAAEAIRRHRYLIVAVAVVSRSASFKIVGFCTKQSRGEGGHIPISVDWSFRRILRARQ